ncbi:MAG: hypothetical protein DRN14_04280 [Thermoplasmata archaeon]|nr:MAG: hypothetical protein DRN14_04280 [Thermoplasmata archaeon]HDJ27447.1 hypothetical protein [Aciduliprofundum sp.]
MEELEEQIRAIEEELRRTEYNKRTEKHIGKLKAKLARLRRELEKRRRAAASRRTEGIRKIGDGTVVIVGLPNSGKSTLFSALTGLDTRISERPFTTTEPRSGTMEVGPMLIQVIDTPPLVPGGRNGPVLSLARMADALVVLLAPWDDPAEVLGILHEGGIRPNAPGSPRGILVRSMRDLGGAPPGLPLALPSEAPRLAALIPRILGLIVVYTRPPRAREREPMVLRRGSRVSDALRRLGIGEYRKIVLERSGLRREVDPEEPLSEGDTITVYRR